MQKWYDWLPKLKKEDEKEKLEQLRQQKVKQMIKSAVGSAGPLHKITKDTAWREVGQRGSLTKAKRVRIWKKLRDCTRRKQE